MLKALNRFSAGLALQVLVERFPLQRTLVGDVLLAFSLFNVNSPKLGDFGSSMVAFPLVMNSSTVFLLLSMILTEPCLSNDFFCKLPESAINNFPGGLWPTGRQTRKILNQVVPRTRSTSIEHLTLDLCFRDPGYEGEVPLMTALIVCFRRPLLLVVAVSEQDLHHW